MSSIYIDVSKTKLMSFPDVVTDEIVLKNADQTLTNKSFSDETTFYLGTTPSKKIRFEIDVGCFIAIRTIAFETGGFSV